MDNKKREYVYLGPEKQVSDTILQGSCLSPSNALAVIKDAWERGRIHISAHFREQASGRRFDTLDVERAIQNGTILSKGEYCGDFGNWKYRLNGQSGGVSLEIVLAIDACEDYMTSPLVILITAYWR